MKILAINGISKNGTTTLQEAGFDIIETNVAQNQLENFINQENIDVLLINETTQVHQELIDACPSLKLIGCNSKNTDAIDTQYAIDQGIHIITPSEATSESVAELVFAHLFGMVRFLHQSNREMPLEADINFKGLQKTYKGTELKGKTLGIIGMTPTGIATAKIALGIGMRVVFSNNVPKTCRIPVEFFDGQGVEFSFEAQPLETVLKEADFISLHNAIHETYVISTSEFEQMKTGVGIVNCAYGGALDEIALINAIESGKVKYAGLDVFEKEPTPEIQLLMNSELSLTPHISEKTVEAQDRIDIELAQKIVNLLG